MSASSPNLTSLSLICVQHFLGNLITDALLCMHRYANSTKWVLVAATDFTNPVKSLLTVLRFACLAAVCTCCYLTQSIYHRTAASRAPQNLWADHLIAPLWPAVAVSGLFAFAIFSLLISYLESVVYFGGDVSLPCAA